jgi:hypothetical protein
LKLWPIVVRGTWLLASFAAIAFWVLMLFADGLLFLQSYTEPLGTYTGQEWDRGASWLLLGVLVGASALAIAVVWLPAAYRRIRILARAEGQGVLGWLARRRQWRLAGMLMSFNGPLVIVMAVAAMLTAIATSYHRAPVGAPLWAAGAGIVTAAVITAVEIFLLRRGLRHPVRVGGW